MKIVLTNNSRHKNESPRRDGACEEIVVEEGRRPIAGGVDDAGRSCERIDSEANEYEAVQTLIIRLHLCLRYRYTKGSGSKQSWEYLPKTSIDL